MKQIFTSLLCLFFCMLHFTACSNDNNATETEKPQTGNINKGKTLVVYFSCTNTTKGIAEHIAHILSADEFRIEPVQPYTTSDLNYNDNNCRANQEQNNNSSRPAIANSIEKIADYDFIYVGFPIWWGKLPKIMYTFFETYNMNGKIIIPFCTSGSSDISTAMTEIKLLAPNAIVKDGRRFESGANESTVKSWIESFTSDKTN